MNYIPFILLSLAVGALAVISMVPGGDSACTSLPMVILWGAVAVAASFYIVRRRLYRRAAVFTLHAAFLIILLGAFVTWLTGTSDVLRLRVGEPTALGNFTVTLADFEVDYYPGTQAPRDFISTLDVDGVQARVSMNKTLNIGSYRIFQTAYDPDMRGTVLTVASDRTGTAISYSGYALLAIAMLWCMVDRFRLRPHRHGVLLVLLSAGVLGASAAPPAIPEDIADRMGDIMVYRSGRIMPLSTLANDFTLKVAGTDSPAGLTPMQYMAGWLFFYDDFKTLPTIKVKGEGRIALTDFFDASGSYRFSGVGYPAQNEKFSLISEDATGALWKIFPQQDSAGYHWLSPVDNPSPDTPVDEWHFMRHGLNYLAELAATDRWVDFSKTVDKIIIYQQRKAAGVLPSPLQVKCERLFIAFTSSAALPVIFLLAGIALFLFFNLHWSRFFAAAGAVATAIVITLGWIASESVPLTDGSQTMLCLSFVVFTFGLIIGRKNAQILPLAIIVGAMALMVALMGSRQPQVTQAVPVLRSPLLSIHVLAVTCAYALLALIAMCGAAWLLGRRELLAIGRSLLEPAVFLMAAGIFIGAVWANTSWGRYWGWDPKETWALITMLVYCLPLHRASLPAFSRPRVFAWYSLVAFVTVLVTYFGVNFLMSGLHSYA